MGGGYFSCGAWQGTDKSAKRIFNTFDALKRHSPATLHPSLEVLGARARNPYEQQDFTFWIEPTLAANLIQPLKSLLASEGIEQQNGLVFLETDVGAAVYGPSDLLEACKVSRATGHPIQVHYD